MDLLTLRARTRAKADESAVDFIDNTKLDASINAAHRWVYKRLAQKFEDLFLVEGTTVNTGKFDTVSSTSGYNLPSTLMKLAKVECRPAASTSENDYRPVDKSNLGAHDGENWTPIREGYLPFFTYFIAGTKVYFRPVPSETFTVRLWFVPRATAMTATSDTPSVDEDYHELIAELASLDLLGTSGEPIFAERMKLFEIQNGLIDEVAQRDQRSQVMVMDFNEVGVVR